MVASRTAKKLPAPPVFKREVVAVPEGGRGRKGASDLEAAVRANAEAAEEARRVAMAQRRALEEIAAQRQETEKQLVSLRHEMAEERSEHDRLVTQARFRATQEERRRHENAPATDDGVPASPVVAPSVTSPAMRTLHGQIAEREQLGESHRQRLLEALRERDSARLELQRVSDARTHAERRLERVTEVLHRATSAGGPRPAGDDGVESQQVRALRDELAVAIARAKSAESRTNELRDEIHAVKDQRVSTNESLEATRDDLDLAREELSALHARLIEVEAEQRNAGSVSERVEIAEARAREIEREVMDARSRAVDAEQRVADLTASLSSTSERAELSLVVTTDLQRELAEARRRAEVAEAEVVELAERQGHVEGELAARTAELEAKLDAAVIEHGHHAVDLEATHAATAAELTSASAQAEHLATEITAAQARVHQLEAALAATTTELGDLRSAHDGAVATTNDRDAELAHLAGELDARDLRLEDLEAALIAAVDESSAAVARCQSLTDDLEAATRAEAVTEAALGTARAERDVAVAQADSLTLELGQRNSDVERAEARIADCEREVSTIDTDHRDALQRLEDLGRELVALRNARDDLVANRAELDDRFETIKVELTSVRARADELENNRSDDRNIAEKAIEGFRTKSDSASARAVMMEEELGEMRARHTNEMERMVRSLGAAEARCIELERSLAAPRPGPIVDTDVRSGDAPRPVTPVVTQPVAAADPVPVVEEVEAPVPVGAGVGARSSDAPRAPSDLRRAVFASLTELAGDG